MCVCLCAGVRGSVLAGVLVPLLLLLLAVLFCCLCCGGGPVDGKDRSVPLYSLSTSLPTVVCEIKLFILDFDPLEAVTLYRIVFW